ncbi:MAG: DUF2812 domain-containing protein [Oscillospiraceae bacterium]|nr:DUF2812 domain-containing protein [Oscillospiraceae bacterium]
MRLGFFPYEAIHYKAAQAYLDKKAAKGWQLREVKGNFALFDRAENPRHFVDLEFGLPPHGDPSREEYFQICYDAGWEHIQTVREMLIFRAMPGTDPLPIQTDREIEWERFQKSFHRTLWNHSLFLGLYALLMFLINRAKSPRALADPYEFFIDTAYLFVCLSGLLFTVLSLFYLLRCRSARQIKAPGKTDTLSYIPLYLSLLILFLILLFDLFTILYPLPTVGYTQEEAPAYLASRPIVTVQDLGFSDGYGSTDARQSPVITYYGYFGNSSYGFRSEYYSCLTEGLARWAFDRRAREAESRNASGLSWRSAPGLGFDECYTAYGGAYLLFRQDKVVVLVCCSGVDLTAPEYLTAIRSRVLGEAS